MHHANVDRLWDVWQQRRIDNGLSADHLETYPDAAETSPFDRRIPPEGHKVGDAMWPWIGGTPAYMSGSVSQAVRNRLPIFQSTPFCKRVGRMEAPFLSRNLGGERGGTSGPISACKV